MASLHASGRPCALSCVGTVPSHAIPDWWAGREEQLMFLHWVPGLAMGDFNTLFQRCCEAGIIISI